MLFCSKPRHSVHSTIMNFSVLETRLLWQFSKSADEEKSADVAKLPRPLSFLPKSVSLLSLVWHAHSSLPLPLQSGLAVNLQAIESRGRRTRGMAVSDEVGSGPGGAAWLKALVGLSKGLSLTLSTHSRYLTATWNSSCRRCNSIFWLSCIHMAYTHADIDAEVIKMKTKSFKNVEKGPSWLLTGQEILGTIVYRSLNVGSPVPQGWVPEKLKWRKWADQHSRSLLPHSWLWIQSEHSPQASTTVTAPPQVPEHWTEP